MILNINPPISMLFICQKASEILSFFCIHAYVCPAIITHLVCRLAVNNTLMQGLKNGLEAIPRLDVLEEKDLMDAGQYFALETMHSGEVLLNPGRTCKRLYFIHTGLVFSCDRGGRILWYESEGNSFTDIHSFYKQKPSQNFIKIAEDQTRLVSIHHSKLQDLYNRSHRWAKWGTRFRENEIVRLVTYYENLRTRDASERYFDLLSSHPGILQRIPLGHIASYLGISQVSLSRIRAGSQKKE